MATHSSILVLRIPWTVYWVKEYILLKLIPIPAPPFFFFFLLFKIRQLEGLKFYMWLTLHLGVGAVLV